MNLMKFPAPTVRTSVEELLLTYIREKHLSDPSLFGLESFSAPGLLASGFSCVGDSEFSLYEREFRMLGGNHYVNLKIYFKNGELLSNGVSLNGGRICRYLDFLGGSSSAMDVSSLEILWDESCDYGSIILNGYLDIRYGIIGNVDRRKKFHLLGISTDYEISSPASTSRISTHGARVMKDGGLGATRKKMNRLSVAGLIDCINRNFAGAIDGVFVRHPSNPEQSILRT